VIRSLLGRGAPVALLVLWVSIGIPSPASGQRGSSWSQSHDPYVAAFGLAAGAASGSGLAFRWPVLPQTMATLAGGVWGSSDDLDWNVGLELHYVLRQVGRTRLFAGPAAALYSNGDDTPDVNATLGIGLEYLLSARLALKADVGFTYLSDGDKIYPLPQLAIFYYF
jgi:hypothetical protein